MVRGREVDVPDANGTLTPQICKLSKKVDALVVGPQAASRQTHGKKREKVYKEIALVASRY